jgi:hypothetical protein
MGKAGQKQKRLPKKTDKKQFERFLATVRKIGADETTETLDRVFEKIVPPKRRPSKPT